jgi:hypothetical protein
MQRNPPDQPACAQRLRSPCFQKTSHGSRRSEDTRIRRVTLQLAAGLQLQIKCLHARKAHE